MTEVNVERKEIRWTRKKVISLVLVCILLSTVPGFGGATLADHLKSSEKTPVQKKEAGADTQLEKVTEGNLSVQEVSAKNSESVVEIRTEKVTQDPWLQEYVTQGGGSGIIIRSNGYILTNQHVINGARTIYVSNKSDKAGSEKEYVATLVGVNTENDLAVLKIDGENLKPVTFGNSDHVKPGDLAVVIGNPLGSLGDTVSAGVVSAKDRTITIDNQTMSLMQTDASVNPGNSGGGMFDSQGELIGVVVAKTMGSNVEGLGFAIPVNVAVKISDEIIEKEGDVSASPSAKAGAAYSGMGYIHLTDEAKALSYGVPSPGVYIQSVREKNPREAGFQPRDMVYSIDGKRIDNLGRLKEAISRRKPGDKAIFVVLRDGEKITIPLELMAR